MEALSIYWKKAVALTLCVMSVGGAAPLWADEAPAGGAEANLTPHQVVEKTTHRVMDIITEAQDYFDENPERFYSEIHTVLDDVVDFDSFARGVMGEYASKRMFMSLETVEQKKQFIANMKRFSDTFKEGLVKTYAKGLLAFSGNRIEVLEPEEPAKPGESATVIQHIYGDAEKPYVVRYKLRQDSSLQWKLRNVTIEAINLGKVYRSQFASAVKQYDGDIDKVIDNWSVDPTGGNTDVAEADAPAGAG